MAESDEEFFDAGESIPTRKSPIRPSTLGIENSRFGSNFLRVFNYRTQI